MNQNTQRFSIASTAACSYTGEHRAGAKAPSPFNLVRTDAPLRVGGRLIHFLCFPEKRSTFAPLQDGGPPARDLPRLFDRASASPDALDFPMKTVIGNVPARGEVIVFNFDHS